MSPVDALFGYRKIRTFGYPILGANVSATPQTLNFDLKDFLQKETLTRLQVRFFGNIVIAGVGPGTATGRENPEALLVNAILTTNPSLGVILLNNLSAQHAVRYLTFERGYTIKAATVADAAGTTAVDFALIFNFKKPGAINPIEWGLPLSMFQSAILQLTVGSRDQLFSGGTNTWDVSGLQIQIIADYDVGVAGQFHVVETFEKLFTITASQSDFPITTFEPGYIYTDFLFRTLSAGSLINTVLNSITLQSAGRIWLPQGDVNALNIQRHNRETHISDPAVVQTGLYYVSALRDGMYKRAVDALDSRLDMKLDVTLQGSPTQVVISGKRIIPLALNAVGVRPVGAAA